MRRIAVLLFLAAAPAVVAQDTAAVSRRYQTAIDLAEQGHLPAAVALMDSVMVDVPDASNGYWNLGLWHAELEEPAKALASWQAYRKLRPDDWHVRAKLIQAYQALGDTVSRNAERAALLELRRSKTDKALKQFPMYCREQFRVGTQRVMAFEVFEPKGDRRVFYTFAIIDSTGHEVGRYSLGSYEQTTQVARELGEIGKKDRLYHLDWYAPNVHATYGFYKALLSYEDTRAAIVSTLSGEHHPMSQTQRQ